MNVLSRLSFRYPVATVLASVACIIAALHFYSQLKPDNSTHNWFSADSTTYKAYKDFVDAFTDDVNIVVVYQNPDLFSPPQLTLNRELTHRLSELDNVKQVSSLSNAKVLVNNGLRLAWVPLIPKQVLDPGRLRRVSEKNALVRKRWLSQDGQSTVLKVTLRALDDRAINKTMQDIKALLRLDSFSVNEYRLAGLIPIVHEMDRVSKGQGNEFLLINMGIMLILLTVAFRSLLLSILCVFSAVASSVLSMGVFAAVGNTSNIVSSIMPMLILVIGVADSVHIISYFRSNNTQNVSNHRSLARALKLALRPCLFTSLTTAIAFLTFTISDIPPLANMGLYTSLTLVIPFVVSFSLLPSLILITGRFARMNKSFSTDYYKTYSDFIFKQKNLLALVLLVAVALSLFGLPKVNFETDQIKYLAKSNPARQAIEDLQEWFGAAIYPVEVIIQGENPEVFHDKKTLSALFKLQDQLAKLEPVREVFSTKDILQHVVYIINDKAVFDIQHLSDRFIARVLENSQKGSERFISLENSQYRISLQCRWLSNEELQHLWADIKQASLSLQTFGLTTSITGQAVLDADINKRLISSQISSFVSSLLLIFLTMLLMFKRWKIALLAMLPNLLPVLVTLGSMGWIGVKLDVATVLIAAVSLGIAIDDSIHFLHAYTRQLSRGKSVSIALKSALDSVGKPILITSLVLICGFLSMVNSTFVPLVYLGIFFSVNVMIAYLADVILIPAFMSLFRTSMRQNSS